MAIVGAVLLAGPSSFATEETDLLAEILAELESQTTRLEVIEYEIGANADLLALSVETNLQALYYGCFFLICSIFFYRLLFDAIRKTPR